MQYKTIIDSLMRRHNCYRLLKTNSFSVVAVLRVFCLFSAFEAMLIKSCDEWLQAFRFIFNQWKMETLFEYMVLNKRYVFILFPKLEKVRWNK